MPIFCKNNSPRNSGVNKTPSSNNKPVTMPDFAQNQWNPVGSTGNSGNTNNGSGNGSSSKSGSSLIMAINRFKSSVKEMKETVLIPTRLNDLVHNYYQNQIGYDNNCIDENQYMEQQQEQGQETHSVLQLNRRESSIIPKRSPSPSMHFNLYEQYKLLDVIDKILSSDTLLAIGMSSNRNQINGVYVSSNGYSHQENIHHNEDCNNNPWKPRLRTPDDDDDGDDLAKRFIENCSGSNSCRNSPDCSGALFCDATSSNVFNNGTDHQPSPLNKIKEKLEYHLISLKSILNMMSDGAEYITRTYLEDIQCENRFETFQKPNGEQNESLNSRHYYTSN